MLEIKKVLDLPIQKGYINWDNLEKKVHAAIVALIENEEMVKAGEAPKLGDEIDFCANAPGDKGNMVRWAYKLYSPRFLKGKLWCSGFMLGKYMSENANDPLWFPKTQQRF
jgi:hypothetical protein